MKANHNRGDSAPPGNTNYSEINFAIPCVLSNGKGFINVVEQLAGTATDDNYGYVSGRKVKFGFSPVASDTDASKVYISSVTAGSIADGSGLKVGDQILSVKLTRNNEVIVSKTVDSLQGLIEVLESIVIGDGLEMEVSRKVKVGRDFWGDIYDTQTATVSMQAEQFFFCNTGK